jgi:hypothetical protein
MTQTDSSQGTLFKWVERTTIGQLKAMTDDSLEDLRETLANEARSADRARRWVEGIIKLKIIERDKVMMTDACASDAR